VSARNVGAVEVGPVHVHMAGRIHDDLVATLLTLRVRRDAGGPDRFCDA
jgi:hypothetical protein